MSDFDKAMGKLVTAVEQQFGAKATGLHINRGESEDYARGWNAGYDDNQACEAYDEAVVDRMAPPDEPYRSSYIRGYNEGWKFFNEGEDCP